VSGTTAITPGSSERRPKQKRKRRIIQRDAHPSIRSLAEHDQTDKTYTSEERQEALVDLHGDPADGPQVVGQDRQAAIHAARGVANKARVSFLRKLME
jgi:hypothetical protein